MLSTTAFLTLTMQCAPTVHPDTALDVARVESGFNPYAIAEIIPQAERKPGNNGVISHYPKSKDEAISIIDLIAKKKRRYSVGLMQITSTNFSRYGISARDVLTPCTNLSVFEKIITDCYQRGGSLKRALSCYYDGNFSTGKKKEEKFNNTSYIERIGYKNDVGYKVPSVKEDKGKFTREFINKGNRPLMAFPSVVIYPSHFVRGDVQY